jgi:hypothetical protein
MESENQGDLPGEGRAARVTELSCGREGSGGAQGLPSHAKPAAESNQWRK